MSKADVCLILEGTYPYVRGGVASWVHAIISGLPHLTFSLLCISPNRKHSWKRKYELPNNVVDFVEVFIHELIEDKGDKCPRSAKKQAWDTVKRYHENDAAKDDKELWQELLGQCAIKGQRTLSVKDAFYSREAWDFVNKEYRKKAPGTSFIDYFWTWRAVHAPLFQTLLAEIPEAKIYHSISTGYAGLLGVIAKQRFNAPFLLTEHGIYVRERAIDIAQANWIYEEPVRLKVANQSVNPLKDMWIKFFVSLGKHAYQAADQIVTLFEGNRELQVELGADAEKTSVVPNGVRVDTFAPLFERRQEFLQRPMRVGLVGRVVPIKDIKTFIRAAAIVNEKMPGVEFWVVGPTDEDEEYFKECKDYVETINLTNFTFLGMQNVRDIYPQIDIMLLTSLSEGQPLTVIEAAFAGIPTVSTDVGACSELVYGRAGEDAELGVSGMITKAGDPQDTARALMELLRNNVERKEMGQRARKRAQKYYRLDQMLESYGRLYEKWGGQRWPA